MTAASAQSVLTARCQGTNGLSTAQEDTNGERYTVSYSDADASNGALLGADHDPPCRRMPKNTAAHFPPVVGGKWSSGLPFLNAKLKKEHPSKAGIRLDLVSVDSAPLKVSIS